jgi:hypothetical protein
MIKRKHIKYAPANVEEIEKALEAILRSFVWAHTTQGHDYWSNVCTKLRKIISQAEGKA